MRPLPMIPAWGSSFTRAQWRALGRAQLGDEGAIRLWSDSLLNGRLNEVIRDFARQLPRESAITLTPSPPWPTRSFPTASSRSSASSTPPT